MAQQVKVFANMKAARNQSHKAWIHLSTVQTRKQKKDIFNAFDINTEAGEMMQQLRVLASPAVVTHAFNASTRKTEADGSL